VGLCEAQKSGISPADIIFSRNSTNSVSSRDTPTKLVLWSFQMQKGLPHCAMNRHKQAMNAAEERSVTASKCTTLIDRHGHEWTNVSLD